MPIHAIPTSPLLQNDTLLSESVAGPERMAWKINREIVLLLGWGRAILLQLAHPMVAQGVADHSLFVKCPRLRRRRLQQTLRAMLALTFGTTAEVEQAARRINAIHDQIQGELRESVGDFQAGATYSAHDPALLRWVHATLLDSFPLAYRMFVGPLSDTEVDRYFREATGIAPLLGIPEGYLPANRDELHAYLSTTMASGEIAVGETAKRLARDLLEPLPWLPAFVRPLLWPLIWSARLPAIGTLPPEIRRQYGFRWTRWHQAVLNVMASISRFAVPRLPAALRFWPAARRAVQRNRSA
jgi:uncharacterized protein (DUF2236 family)